MPPLRVTSLVLLMLAFLPAAGAAPTPALVPLPESLQLQRGSLSVNASFAFGLRGPADPRVAAAAQRLIDRWRTRTGLPLAAVRPDAPSGLARLEWERIGNALPVLGEDESYELQVSGHRLLLRSPTSTGILRGLATLEQLLGSHRGRWSLPAVVIRDRPRFPWRGLLVDVARHWQPPEVIRRTLDAMALVKLNVLHLHLTEDQGFRIESRTHPELHQLGSDGDFFTQEQMRELIAYAAARGIRVVPEFDLPGHATSWLVSHPELGSRPGPYAIVRRWGIFDGILDPTNEQTYALLDDFLGEMAALFPDAYLHIGGDEVPHETWDRSERIQAFIREHGLGNHTGLQAHFNRRLESILARHGKRMIGWDEILHPNLPAGTVIQSWRGPDGLAAAARAGFDCILSNGYYIDLCHPTLPHYLNDPLPADTPLTAAEQRRVLGGEATMWSEWVTPETIDSRLWPRTAAIAERLWSPAAVRDGDDLYRRLAQLEPRLEENGSRHRTYVEPLLRRLAGDRVAPADLAALRTVADLVEPVKGYRRIEEQPDKTQQSPLDGLVDASRPDSAPSRAFTRHVDRWLAAPDAALEERRQLRTLASSWLAAAQRLRTEAAPASPRIAALGPLLERIETASRVTLATLDDLERPPPVPAAARERLARLTAAAVPHDACELPFLPALRRLVAGAALLDERPRQPPPAWREAVEALAFPPVEPPAGS